MQSPYADNDGDEPDNPGIIVLLKRKKSAIENVVAYSLAELNFVFEYRGQTVRLPSAALFFDFFSLLSYNIL